MLRFKRVWALARKMTSLCFRENVFML